MGQIDRRELNNGFGNALSKAVEMVVTPLIFAVIGHLIDRWLNTGMVFALGFGVFTLAYVSWKSYMVYDAQMRDEEDRILKRQRPA